MKIFFAYASAGGYRSEFFNFTQTYIAELKKHCDVKCAFLSFGDGSAPEDGGIFDFVLQSNESSKQLSEEERLLEKADFLRRKLNFALQEFKPDVIHCAGRYAFLPFRGDKNVFYSTDLNFEDSPDGLVRDELQFQNVKTERLALMHSAIAEVYSESAAEKAKKLCGGMCSPVVVPCGAPRSETQDDCIKNRLRTLKEGRKLCVSFFGEFDNSSDGALSFIFAVNRLGRNFKTAHKIKYCLYGSGSLNPAVSLELFDKISHAPKDAFAKSDIVVLPRSSDNLGYTALNAMAAASLVLTPRSLASDMFCESGYNCLEIPHDVPGIARAVLDAAVNFRSYAPIADNARRTAKFWNIGRIVRFNVYAYRRIAEGRHDRLVSAYGEDERGIIQKFYRSHDTEKLYNQDLERLAALKTLEVLYEDNKSVLLLTGASGIEKDALPENAMAYSVLNETTQGITLRPECLPFEDDSYDTVILTGAWEAAANPCSALMELQRIAKENIVIVYNKGLPRSWQHIRMDEKDDWTKINASAFYCSEEDGMPNLASPVDCLECDEPVRRNAEIKNKIREVIEALNGRTTLDAVVYTSRRVFMNAQTA